MRSMMPSSERCRRNLGGFCGAGSPSAGSRLRRAAAGRMSGTSLSLSLYTPQTHNAPRHRYSSKLQQANTPQNTQHATARVQQQVKPSQRREQQATTKEDDDSRMFHSQSKHDHRETRQHRRPTPEQNNRKTGVTAHFRSENEHRGARRHQRSQSTNTMTTENSRENRRDDGKTTTDSPHLYSSDDLGYPPANADADRWCRPGAPAVTAVTAPPPPAM